MGTLGKEPAWVGMGQERAEFSFKQVPLRRAGLFQTKRLC